MGDLIRSIAIGLAIGLLLLFVGYTCLVVGGVSLPFFPAFNGDAPIQSFPQAAVFCGILVYGFVVLCMKTRSCIAGAVVLVLLFTGRASGIPVLETAAGILLWVPAVLLFPLGCVPALILSLIRPAFSPWELLALSALCGYPIGCLLSRFFRGSWPWHTLWFKRPHAHTPWSGLKSRLRPKPRYEGLGGGLMDSDLLSCSGDRDEFSHDDREEYDGGYSSSFDRDDDLSGGFAAGDGRFYSDSGRFAGVSESDGYGGARFYDSSGRFSGVSESDGYGGSRFYSSSGQFEGVCEPDGRGGFRRYDSSGRFIGVSEPDGSGGYRHYDAQGHFIGTSE